MPYSEPSLAPGRFMMMARSAKNCFAARGLVKKWALMFNRPLMVKVRSIYVVEQVDIPS